MAASMVNPHMNRVGNRDTRPVFVYSTKTGMKNAIASTARIPARMPKKDMGL